MCPYVSLYVMLCMLCMLCVLVYVSSCPCYVVLYYAKIPYYVVLYMQRFLIMKCFVYTRCFTSSAIVSRSWRAASSSVLTVFWVICSAASRSWCATISVSHTPGWLTALRMNSRYPVFRCSSLITLDTSSGRIILAICHSTSVCHGVFTPES